MNKRYSLIILSVFFSSPTYASDLSDTMDIDVKYGIVKPEMVREMAEMIKRNEIVRNHINLLQKKIRSQKEIIQKQEAMIADYERLVSVLRIELEKAKNNGK